METSEPLIHVVDFEGSLRTGVVEFGVVTLDRFQIKSVHTRLCRNRGAISDREHALHRLGDEDLHNYEPFESEWERFLELRQTGVLAAHSAAAEDTLLRGTWRFPRAVPDWLSGAGEVVDWGPWIDTERLWREIAAPGASGRLESVVNELGLEAALEQAALRWCPRDRRQWHCAPYDALAAALVLERLAGHFAKDTRWMLALSAPAESREGVGQGELF